MAYSPKNAPAIFEPIKAQTDTTKNENHAPKNIPLNRLHENSRAGEFKNRTTPGTACGIQPVYTP